MVFNMGISVQTYTQVHCGLCQGGPRPLPGSETGEGVGKPKEVRPPDGGSQPRCCQGREAVA